MARIDLSAYQPGAWAEVRDTPSWRLVKETQELLDDTSRAAQIRWFEAAVREFVTAWNVSCNGAPAPLPKEHPEILDDIDGRIVVAIASKVQEILLSVTPNPNSESGSSAS